MSAVIRSLTRRYKTVSDAPSEIICRRVRYPLWAASAVNELLSRLTFPEVWDGQDGADNERAAWTMADLFTEFRESVCMSRIGEIVPHAIGTLPTGWLPCDGTQYAKSAYPELYDKIAPQFRVTSDIFRVPDLQSRMPIGEAVAAVAPLLLGQFGGAASVILTVANLALHQHTTPNHSHVIANHAHSIAAQNVSGGFGTMAARANIGTFTGGANFPALSNNPTSNASVDVSLPTFNVPAQNTGSAALTMSGANPTTNFTGSGEAFSVRNPYQVVRYAIIALDGA